MNRSVFVLLKGDPLAHVIGFVCALKDCLLVCGTTSIETMMNVGSYCVGLVDCFHSV